MNLPPKDGLDFFESGLVLSAELRKRTLTAKRASLYHTAVLGVFHDRYSRSMHAYEPWLAHTIGGEYENVAYRMVLLRDEMPFSPAERAALAPVEGLATDYGFESKTIRERAPVLLGFWVTWLASPESAQFKARAHGLAAAISDFNILHPGGANQSNPYDGSSPQPSHLDPMPPVPHTK